MWTDPIVDEVREAREEYAASFGYDLDAIFQDLRIQQEEARKAGWTIVSRTPGSLDKNSGSAA